MWQVVYNNDFPPDGPIARNAGVIPPHWVPARNPDAWDLSPYGGRVFEFRGSTGPAELVFQPGRTAPPVFGPYRPHNGYNAPQAEEQNMNVASAICTDWQLQAVLMRRSDEPAEVTMIFESNGDRFAARFALDGRVQLLHQRRDQDSDDPAAWQLWDEATLEALPVGEGRVVALSTVDYRATLWVDGEPVCTSSEQQYSGDYDRAVRQATLQPRLREARLEVESLQAKLRNHDGETAEQLQRRLADARRQRDRLSEQIEWERTPSVRLRADGPGRCQLWHLVLNRDVYYTSPVLKDTGGSGAEYEYVRRMRTPDGDLPNNWVKNDNGEYRAWGTLGNPIRLRQVDPDGRSGLDEFFCMGDNSPQSHDGRTWVAAAPSLKLYDEQGRMQYQLGTVLRYNMLGRALWVYWPAGYRLPVVGLPIIPNVGKMRLIR
jgi:hypothetical protein